MSTMDAIDSPGTPSDLPPRRAAVLAFLHRELAAGRAPSLAEIAQAFGFVSRNAALKHVQALVADGWLEQAPGRKRGLGLPGGRADLLPLAVLGRVAAGMPISAEGAARLGATADALPAVEDSEFTPWVTQILSDLRQLEAVSATQIDIGEQNIHRHLP